MQSIRRAGGRLLYAGPYESTITQVTDGLPTSSLSCESVVADMLDSLMLQPDHTTLELGTATGRNARLLAAQAGPGRVVSVEYDPQPAETATANIEATGGGVEIRVGDGDLGAPAARTTASSPSTPSRRSHGPGWSRPAPAAASSRPGADSGT